MPVTMGGNRSKWRPNSAAAMNNNPQGVQSVMQPVAPPMAPRPFAPRPVAPNPLPSASPGYGPPATTGGGPPTGNPPGSNLPAVRPPGPPAVRPPGGPPAVRPTPYIPNIGATVSPAPSRGMVDQFAQTPYGQAAGMTPRTQPAAPSIPKMNTAPVGEAVDPAAPATGSRMPMSDAAMPGMEAMVGRWRQRQDAFDRMRMQGRDPNNPSQFDVRNVGPGGGYFVDRGGQIQPRQDTSMARNVMAGQPAEASASFGRPMNIPGATQTFNGQTYTQPQNYNPGGGYGPTGNGLIPGSAPRLNPQDEAARASQYNQMYKDSRGSGAAMSPDEYRVLTDGRAMVSPAEARMSGPVSGGNPMSSTSATIQNRNARARGVRGSDVAQWSARRNAEMQAAMTPTGEAATPVGPPAPAGAATPSQVQPSNPNDPTAYGSNPFGSMAMWAWRNTFGGQDQTPPPVVGQAPPVAGQTPPVAGQDPTAPLSPPSVPKLNVVPANEAVSNRPDASQKSAGRPRGVYPWRRRPTG